LSFRFDSYCLKKPVKWPLVDLNVSNLYKTSTINECKLQPCHSSAFTLFCPYISLGHWRHWP